MDIGPAGGRFLAPPAPTPKKQILITSPITITYHPPTAAGLAKGGPRAPGANAGIGDFGANRTAARADESPRHVGRHFPRDEVVNYLQPNASAIALSRILGSGASRIFGWTNAPMAARR
jgi:hypothetical protein